MEGARSILLSLAMVCFAVPVTAQQSPADARPSRKGEVLLLEDGQLIEFPFTTRDDGYDVRFPGGPQFIESSRVLCVASSRTAAWRHLRSTFPGFTPEIHMRLARWCLKHQLDDCAERELLDALNLDPNRGDAQSLLEELTGRRLAAAGGSSAAQSMQQIPGAPGMAAAAPAAALGGLTSENARNFVRRIQPLLANRCAAAGCHGPGTTSNFQLTSIRRGSTPLTAERNLAAVLAQVQPDDPLHSQLLVKADQQHGGMQEPAFRGRIGAQQRQILHDWVAAAIADLHPDLAPMDAPVDLDPAVEADDIATRPTNSQDSPAENSTLPHGRPTDRSNVDKELLRQAARSVASDPFSPAVFNRRFHKDVGANPD